MHCIKIEADQVFISKLHIMLTQIIPKTGWLPPKTDFFFMKTVFIDSYKTIEKYYRVIFAKLNEFESQIFFTDLLQIGIYTTYTLINQLYMFHKDQTSTFGILIV